MKHIFRSEIMNGKLTLLGFIIAVVDEQGPRPKVWYPTFAEISQIHNSAVKSFSIMIGEKIYREKPLHELTCFGVLPFKDLNAIGFIHFFGVENTQKKKNMKQEIPTTITILFPETQSIEIYQKCPQIHHFLEKENKVFWPFVQDGNPDPQKLRPILKKLTNYLNTL